MYDKSITAKQNEKIIKMEMKTLTSIEMSTRK